MFFVERSRLWDFPFVSPKLHLFLDRSEEKKKNSNNNNMKTKNEKSEKF